MSGQQIGTVVGGIIGSFIPVVGTYWGSVIGGIIGGVVAPEHHRAPGIGDAQKQTSQAGVPRPVVYGHPAPFSGNIIDGEQIARKIIVEEEQGKGGPVIESERFLLTSAIRICEGPIAGVVRIWRNGTVVYDARADDDFPEWSGADASERMAYIADIRAQSATFLNNNRIYLGTEDQLPDPALEAIHGVGNTPYFRGTAYHMIVDDDVTEFRGAAAQWQYEVMSVASAVPVGIEAPSQTVPFSFQSNEDVNTELLVNIVDVHIDGDMALLFQVESFDLWMVNRFVVQALYGPTSDDVTMIPPALSANYVNTSGIWDSGWLASDHPQAEIAIEQFEEWCGTNGVGFPVITHDPPVPQFFSAPKAAKGLRIYTFWFPGTAADAASGVLAIKTPDDIPGVTATVSPDAPGIMIGSDGNLYYPDWSSGIDLDALEPGDVTLSSTVDDIADRCGVPASKIDTTALLTDIIPGFLVAVQSSGADCIRPTQQMFFFDMPEYDGKIRAVKRGGASVATITDDDLLESENDESDTRGQAVEFPLKVSVVTRDPAADYAAVPQTSIRYSNTVVARGEVVIESPIPFGYDEAKRRAAIIQQVLWARAEGRSVLELPEEWTRLVPSDCFDRNDKRWLIEKTDYAEGAIRLEAAYDRASNYTSTALGQQPPIPHIPISGLRGPTLMAAMNLPPLREQDDVPGAYLAVTGTKPAWDGCTMQMSIDGGATWRNVAVITRRSVMGRLTSDITATTEPIPVELDDGELYDVDAAQIELGFNAFALVPSAGLSEVAQFQNVDTTSGDERELTDVTRGLLLTEATQHLLGDQFVMLANTLFLPINSELYGTVIHFRAVTNGTAPEDNAVYSFLYMAPNEVFVERITEAGDTRITESGETRILE